jgi:hypothetical protein
MNNEAEKKLALPGSSYEIVAKILHAYALSGDEPASLDPVAAKAGMHKTQVSGNNGFLVSIGLLTDGKAKALTPAGKKLALAIGHGLDEDSALEWRRVLLAAPAVKGIIDMIRVQKEIPSAALPGRIASTLGLPDTSPTRTGTNCLINILTTSGILVEKDGKYSLTPEPQSAPGTEPSSDVQPSIASKTSKAAEATSSPPTSPAQFVSAIPIHVNIELHLPPSSEQAVYDALFKSIRENLLK